MTIDDEQLDELGGITVCTSLRSTLVGPGAWGVAGFNSVGQGNKGRGV